MDFGLWISDYVWTSDYELQPTDFEILNTTQQLEVHIIYEILFKISMSRVQCMDFGLGAWRT